MSDYYNLKKRDNFQIENVDNTFEYLNSYDVIKDGKTIYLVYTAEHKNDKNSSVFISSSVDGGKSWSELNNVTKQLTIPVAAKFGNDIQIAVKGNNIILAWQTDGEIPGNGPLAIVSSNDGGLTWQQVKNPTQDIGAQSHADLIVNQQDFHLVWLDDREENGYQGLRYARTSDLGRNWQFIETIDDTTCSCCWNKLYSKESEQVGVLYRNMQPRDMALARLQSNEHGWRQMTPVGEFNWEFDGCPHNGGGIANSRDNGLHASVWTGVNELQGLYYLKSNDNGNHWQPAKQMSKLGYHSDIAVTEDNKVAMVWDEMEADGMTVFANKSNNNGDDWYIGKKITLTSYPAMFPRILAVNDSWLVFWIEQQSKNYNKLKIAIIK